jgi:hypothetical protein
VVLPVLRLPTIELQLSRGGNKNHIFYVDVSGSIFVPECSSYAYTTGSLTEEKMDIASGCDRSQLPDVALLSFLFYLTILSQLQLPLKNK